MSAYENFDSSKFSFVMELAIQGGTNIHLIRVKTNETKTFFIAGTPDHQRLTDHMNSLTDELMLQFFVKGGKPKKEKVQ